MEKSNWAFLPTFVMPDVTMKAAKGYFLHQSCSYMELCVMMQTPWAKYVHNCIMGAMGASNYFLADFRANYTGVNSYLIL